ncbi:MAG: hypothetical protein IT285_15135 [Bdellovibrionales bacterium]|nr:hypothetical protein [Bdellovibrionales bacterium]
MKTKRENAPLRGILALALPLLLGAAQVALSGCHPDPDALDPLRLRWEEDSERGFRHIQAVSRAEGGISVLWWNVGWGNLNADGSLEHNLGELIDSRARPDLIVLAEYKTDTFAGHFRDRLAVEYPEWAFIPYTPASEVGIAVFSPYPMTLSGVRELDWAPRELSAMEQASYRFKWATHAPNEVKHWNRTVARIRWNLPGGAAVNLIPVHLLSPWKAFQIRYGDAVTLATVAGNAKNPLGNQVRNLRAALESEFGPELDSEPFLLVGDFNIPDTVFFSPPTYELISEGLEPVFSGPRNTYPSVSSPEHGKGIFAAGAAMLDHAFLSRQLKPLAHAAPPLKGSDHYPLYFKVNRR